MRFKSICVWCGGTDPYCPSPRVRRQTESEAARELALEEAERLPTLWWVACDNCKRIFRQATQGEQRCWRCRPTRANQMRREWQRISRRMAPIVFTADSYHCRKCGVQDRLTVDHITPLARGGSNELENLQTLCWPCNSKKHLR